MGFRPTVRARETAPIGRLLVSRWARASEYEIRDGIITPARGAKIEYYDPWAAYHDSREKERVRVGLGRGKKVEMVPGPYAALIKLLPDEPGGSELSARLEKRILSWCQRNGLLGLMMCQAAEITLHPAWGWWHEEVDELEEAEYVLVPSQTRYVRTARGWRSSVTYDEYSPELEEEVEERQPLPEEAAVRWSASGATWQPLGSDALQHVPLSVSCARFFPSVAAERANTYQYPQPNTGDFWRRYGEPVGAFLAAARLFRRMMEELADDDVQLRRQGLGRVTSLVSVLSPGAELTENGELRQRWFSPSLISTYGMMLLQDQTGLARARVCPGCGTPHVSRYRQYCTDSCQLNTRQRRHKDKVQEVRKLHREGMNYREIAKTVNTPEDRVKRWILSGLE